MTKPLQLAGQFVVIAALFAAVATISSWPVYRTLPPDHAVIMLSFVHGADRQAECRRLTPAEIAKLPPNMRKTQDCPRGRRPLYVELDLGSQNAPPKSTPIAGESCFMSPIEFNLRKSSSDMRRVPPAPRISAARENRPSGPPDSRGPLSPPRDSGSRPGPTRALGAIGTFGTMPDNRSEHPGHLARKALKPGERFGNVPHLALPFSGRVAHHPHLGEARSKAGRRQSHRRSLHRLGETVGSKATEDFPCPKVRARTRRNRRDDARTIGSGNQKGRKLLICGD